VLSKARKNGVATRHNDKLRSLKNIYNSLLKVVGLKKSPKRKSVKGSKKVVKSRRFGSDYANSFYGQNAANFENLGAGPIYKEYRNDKGQVDWMALPL